MSFAVFSIEGILFLLRWLHIFFGVIWIGHLYYLNFCQGAFFTEIDAPTKSIAIQKLVPRVLWWFRWGAMFTLITGVIMLSGLGHQNPNTFQTARGVLILTGAAMALCMWYNVWFIIWPAQKALIESQGKAADPTIAPRVARGAVCSRTNVLFSIPMLFFMASSTHLPLVVTAASLLPVTIAMAVIILGLELNALKGKMGPMTTVKGVIHCGVALTVVMYVAMELLTK